ncbi:CD3324 family protein [Bacillus sp. 1P06AnD]|uniref:CD3324 family protein n=1 Tax=Bacillus sp. 1P06AnD TaxID=3132208 RepID=UPI0039A29813
MKYQSAHSILPEALLNEVQKYIDGEFIYIPVKGNKRKEWGSQTGAKNELGKRNQAIQNEYRKGIPLDEIAKKYHLSPSTVKNILYRK